MAADQNIVAAEIHQYRRNACLHGHHRLAVFTQGAGKYLRSGKGHKPQQHHQEVPLCGGQRKAEISDAAFAAQPK